MNKRQLAQLKYNRSAKGREARRRASKAYRQRQKAKRESVKPMEIRVFRNGTIQPLHWPDGE